MPISMIESAQNDQYNLKENELGYFWHSHDNNEDWQRHCWKVVAYFQTLDQGWNKNELPQQCNTFSRRLLQGTWKTANWEVDSKSKEPQNFPGNLKAADTRDIAPSKTSSGTEMWCRSEPHFWQPNLGSPAVHPVLQRWGYYCLLLKSSLVWLLFVTQDWGLLWRVKSLSATNIF